MRDKDGRADGRTRGEGENQSVFFKQFSFVFCAEICFVAGKKK